jgi:hypothetical protein
MKRSKISDKPNSTNCITFERAASRVLENAESIPLSRLDGEPGRALAAGETSLPDEQCSAQNPRFTLCLDAHPARQPNVQILSALSRL